MSFNDDQNIECPLCMEPFEMDDFTFFPCTCGYQICRFCWHRIRTDENGLCPACRKQYPEDPADFKPLSVEEFQKIKNEKRQKDQQRKHKMSESRKHLSDVRVVQKNLVFVVGLPTRLADSDILKKHDYFGKYGRIHRVVVNQSTSYAGSQGPSASAYVTYCKPEDALRAIRTVNNIQIDGRTLKASLGTTKYCSHFLKNQQCAKSDCMYLHEMGDEAASFTKDDMMQGKHQEYEMKLQEQQQVCINKKEAASSTPQKKPQSCKETWPSASQNSKVVRAKESKSDKQNRSKSKYTSYDSQKSKKIKEKPDDLSHSNSCSSKNSKSKEDSSGPKRSSKLQKFSKDCVNSSPSPVQWTDGPSVFRNIINTDKQSAVNEMNNKNVQKTLVHIGEQSMCDQSIKRADKASGDSPYYPSSPTSSSSSSLFTPFGSLSSNFLSSSPSPPPHSADHISFSAEESSQHEESGSYSTNNSPQDFVDTATGRPQCVTFNSAASSALSNQLNLLSVSQSCDYYSDSTSQNVTHTTTDLETDPHLSCSFTSQTQQQDDDLDFDPWDESSKGLADLIAKEETVHTSYPSTSIPPGFTHLVQSNVPNQRITPPPGFVCKEQQAESLASTSLPSEEEIHPAMNEPSRMIQTARENCGFYNPNRTSMHYFLPDRHPSESELHRRKHYQDTFKSLFPGINITFSDSVQRGCFVPSAVPHILHPPTVTWLRRPNGLSLPDVLTDALPAVVLPDVLPNEPCWRTAVLQVEEDPELVLNPSYSSPYVLRGQWPSSSQSPPPGFVVPSRSLANTPYQHAEVNQSELRSRDDSIG